MSKDKRELERSVEPQLQEVEPSSSAPNAPELDTGLHPMELLMEQVALEIDALPTRAQLGVLKILVPQLLEQLDAEDRAYWSREILGDGVGEELES